MCTYSPDLCLCELCDDTSSQFYWLVVAEVKPTALFLRVQAPQSSWCRNRKTTWDMLNTSNITATMDFSNYDNFTYDDMLNFLENLNSSDNESDYDDNNYCDPDKNEKYVIKMFQTCAFCLIFFVGVLGNSLVIATFARYRRLRLRSMTDVFLFHLALADLLLLLTLPLQASYTHWGWIFPVALCKVMRACYAINTYSGLLLLGCISVDRYMAVARAQQMLRLRRQILMAGKVAAVVVWIIAILLSFPEIRYSGVSSFGNDTYCVMQQSGHVKMATNGAIIAVFCVSFFTMVICYTSIGVALWEGHVHRRGKQWHRQRTLKLMVALVLVFLIFQLPYTVVLSQKIAGGLCNLMGEYITCTLAYTRCCLNPILYALVGVRFRKDVKQLMHDSGCPCGLQLQLHSIHSTSISASSPALTVLSVVSPTSPDRNCSSSDGLTSVKFQFPTSE
ncbi:C-C chemokine receptor type 10 [Poeciliopsis prolifica]|uniref:C-C chemokine receptor type 10 n=1 Tax=Poeciliopsis prolifica TaxID=188132 RepID=UPI002412F602|nr:C-C chemokine receptor type 10 [Poeciliopsis prolifica]